MNNHTHSPENPRRSPRKSTAQGSRFLSAILHLALITPHGFAQAVYEPYTFTTLAGTPGVIGSLDHAESAARFNHPSGVAVDGAGNVYVADAGNHTIRKVTPAGAVTTLAGRPGVPGSANGAGTEARFNSPRGVAVDSAGSEVHVADAFNNTIREVTRFGLVTTLAGEASSLGSSADGTGNAARFDQPHGVTVDGAGNIYVADRGNQMIRKVTSAGEVTTLAGGLAAGSTDGTGSAARFFWPSGVAVDTAGNLCIADSGNQTIRRLSPLGEVTTVAGKAGHCGSADGAGSVARFWGPSGVAIDSAGNLYVAESYNHTIRKITAAGEVTTLAGLAGSAGSADGAGQEARFNKPLAVAADGGGNVYVADTDNHTIRKITSAGVVTTLAGLAGSPGSADGPWMGPLFHSPSGVAVDSLGNVYVADTYNYALRKVTSLGEVTTLDAWVALPKGVAVDGAGNIYVADAMRRCILKVTPTSEQTNLAELSQGDGGGDGLGVAVDRAGSLYVADSYTHTVDMVTPTGEVTTLAGLAHHTGYHDGIGNAARFNHPRGVAADNLGNVYVADRDNHTIRKVTSAAEVTTLAGLAESPGSQDGTGSAARFNWPCSVAVDADGNVYVADTGNNTIRKVTPRAEVTTLAGSAGNFGNLDGVGAGARFFWPQGIAVDSQHNLYVADTEYCTIRKGYAARTMLAAPAAGWFDEGQFGFTLTRPTGQAVILEASTDLIHWRPLCTNTILGPLLFRDAESRSYSRRFYRAYRPR